MTTKVRLLLCDDHRLFRAGIKAVLREQPGLDVVGEAEDGRAALEQVARLHPDVVLMDIEMPRLDGFEATRRITRAHRGVRVLILTMYAEERLVARCLEAGASGYVLKDVPVSELAYAIEAVARGERYLSPGAIDKVIGARGLPLDPSRTRFDLLTGREREVLAGIAKGLTNKEIASELGISHRTVETHRESLMKKLGIRTVAGLTKFSLEAGLLQT